MANNDTSATTVDGIAEITHNPMVIPKVSVK
jgi:hypothetical protein